MDREKNARRDAKRQGLLLRKSRIDGTWMVIDANTNAMVGGGRNSNGTGGWVLEEVEGFLADGFDEEE